MLNTSKVCSLHFVKGCAHGYQVLRNSAMGSGGALKKSVNGVPEVLTDFETELTGSSRNLAGNSSAN